MTVHEFGLAIMENRDLYSDEEYQQLCDEWKEEYRKYVINKYKDSL